MSAARSTSGAGSAVLDPSVALPRAWTRALLPGYCRARSLEVETSALTRCSCWRLTTPAFLFDGREIAQSDLRPDSGAFLPANVDPAPFPHLWVACERRAAEMEAEATRRAGKVTRTPNA